MIYIQILNMKKNEKWLWKFTVRSTDSFLENDGNRVKQMIDDLHSDYRYKKEWEIIVEVYGT